MPYIGTRSQGRSSQSPPDQLSGVSPALRHRPRAWRTGHLPGRGQGPGAKAALRERHRQVGDLTLDEKGLAT